MILKYFEIGLKYIRKHPDYSLFSIVGLSLAFASVFLIYFHVDYQLSYDRHLETWDRVYRLSAEINLPDNKNTHGILGPRISPVMKEEIPAIEEYCRLRPSPGEDVVIASDQSFYEKEVYNADPEVFTVFPLKFIHGTASGSLEGKGKIVISDKIAEKYFGRVDVLDEKILINDEEFRVTAITESLPQNTHHRLDLLISMESMNPQDYKLLDAEYSENYWRPSCFHFIMLGEKNNIEEVKGQFPSFYEAHMAEFGKRLNAKFTLLLTPLHKVHFTPQFSYDWPKGNRSYTYLFIAAGIFLFLIAGLNSMSLFSSSLKARIKSLGIYKITGAFHKHLYKLIFAETILITGFSVFLSLFFLSAARPYLESYLNYSPFHGNPSFWNFSAFIFILCILLLVISILPVISRIHRPSLILVQGENTRIASGRSTKLGEGSVIFQFIMSVALIISSIIVSKQIHHLLSADVGYNPQNIVQVKINAPDIHPEKVYSFKQELKKSPLVRNASFSSNKPGENLGTVYFDLDKGGLTESRIISLMGVDADYFPLMEMEFREGRNFNRDRYAKNPGEVILNEAGVEFLGLGDSITGTRIRGTVIAGVLKNGKFNSLHEKTRPVAFHFSMNNKGYMNVRLNSSKLSESLSFIEGVYEEFFGEIPFEATFMDETVENMYKDDINQSRLLRIFTLLSLILANIGLLGVVSLINRKKTKEIGIRKVNGAQSWQIILQLNRQILIWIMISMIIAIPVSFYLMNQWLQNFASRIDFEWWIIPIAGLAILIAAMITTSWLTFRAATRNPVETLRYE